jgi:hypothetical protein
LEEEEPKIGKPVGDFAKPPEVEDVNQEHAIATSPSGLDIEGEQAVDKANDLADAAAAKDDAANSAEKERATKAVEKALIRYHEAINQPLQQQPSVEPPKGETMTIGKDGQIKPPGAEPEEGDWEVPK